MTRRPQSGSRHDRAIRVLGGIRVAERAEQLRAVGVEAGKVAELLAVAPDALHGYYALQDELAGVA